MARPKSFSLDEVLRLAAQTFTAGGYEATSVDDLVQALNLHRGSLYKAFGSKRGLFLAVLTEYVRSTLPEAIRSATTGSTDVLVDLTSGTDLDLLLIAAVERGHHDAQVAALVHEALCQLDTLTSPHRKVSGVLEPGARATAILGERLYHRLL